MAWEKIRSRLTTGYWLFRNFHDGFVGTLKGCNGRQKAAPIIGTAPDH